MKKQSIEGNWSKDMSSFSDRMKRYKELYDRTLRTVQNIDNMELEELLIFIRYATQESDTILQEQAQHQYKESGESAMDVQIMQNNLRILTEILHRGSEFNAKTYTKAIHSYIESPDNSENWNKLTKSVCRIANTVRAKPTMLGTINMQPLPSKERQTRRSHSILEPESMPEEVAELKRKDKGAEKVNMLHSQLVNIIKKNNNQPMPVYKVIIDPTNMMASVQNSLQLSFLVRDNVVCLSTGEDGYPTLRLTTAEERQTPRNTQQVIFKITEKFCQEMAAFYKIKKPLLNINSNNTE